MTGEESRTNDDRLGHRLDDWYAIHPSDRPRLVDVRSEAAFTAKRLAPSINLPLPHLLDLLFELPEPSTPLAVLATTREEGHQAIAVLNSRYWQNVPFLFAAEVGIWTSAETLGLVAAGTVAPRDRLVSYTPNGFLAAQIDEIEQGLSTTRSPPFTVCDVGCGAGRDCVFLAKRGTWRVRAVDHLPRSLDRIHRLAARHGVSDVVDCEASSIKGAHVVSSSTKTLETLAASTFEMCQYDLVLVIRFLERDFFPALRAMVKPGGGFLLFVSFVAREDGVPYDHPKDPKKVLEPGELRRAFGEAEGFVVVQDDVEALPDGRFVSAFLARRL